MLVSNQQYKCFQCPVTHSLCSFSILHFICETCSWLMQPRVCRVSNLTCVHTDYRLLTTPYYIHLTFPAVSSYGLSFPYHTLLRLTFPAVSLYGLSLACHTLRFLLSLHIDYRYLITPYVSCCLFIWIIVSLPHLTTPYISCCLFIWIIVSLPHLTFPAVSSY